MVSVMRMPASLAGVTEAAVQAWLAAPGQVVAVGDPLVEIETEKAVFECAAEAAGTVGAILAEPGVALAVGEPIALILEAGEGPDALEAMLATTVGASPGNQAVSSTPAHAPTALASESEPPPEGVHEPASSRRIFASPLVRRLAQERGIALESIRGSGPAGRIVRRDLERTLAPAQPVTPSATPDSRAPTVAPAEPNRWRDVPLTGMRRAIPRRLTESAATVPHFTLTAHCRMDSLLGLRRELNAIAPAPISVNDFIVKAVGGAMSAVPSANAIWNGDSIRQFSSADVAIAVAVEGGLVTPVVRGADRLSLIEIAVATRDLAERARAGGLHHAELEGGSFTVSNLGMLGVEAFTAIINPPHSGILAVGAASRRAVVIDDELVPATVMTVTLSADHRVLDGAIAGEWLTAFTRLIEQPLTLLI